MAPPPRPLPENIALREAEVQDWDSISALLGRPASDGRDLRRRAAEDYDPLLAYVAVEGAAGDAQGFTEGGTVVGAAVSGVSRGARTTPEGELTGRVVWIGVAPQWRRRGIATHLLTAVLEDLRQRGARRAELLVDGTQVEALALFRSAGFNEAGQELGLVLPPAAGRVLVQRAAPSPEPLRRLSLDDLPRLAGLLIHLGMERAAETHDTLEALTPAVLESWLQRPGVVAAGAWERADPDTPLGLAWASRRRDDAVLRFVGVHDDHRRQGIATALLASLLRDLSERGGATGDPPPLRADVADPAGVDAFFRHAGFEVERVTYRMTRSL